MFIFKNKGTRIWFIVTAVVVAFLIVANILLSGPLFTLVCQALGRRRPILAEGRGNAVAYETEMTSKEDARKNAEAINESVVEEGIVLLKNKDGALPADNGTRISVFGKNSVDIVTAGSGSAAGKGEYVVGLDKSLKDAGFTINQTLWDFYKNNGASGNGRPASPRLTSGTDGGTRLSTGETPISSYTDAVKNSYQRSDMALVVFSRLGGESWDLPRQMEGVEGAGSDDDHYLQLDKNERDLITHVTSIGFSKVVVVINTSTTMELGDLEANNKVDAILWIGHPGDTGIMALGRILNGTVNPSGRTVDTFAADFKNDPTWQNFGDNLAPNGGLYTNIGNKNSSFTYAFVDYEEGIYVGYRYYETRGFTDGEAWYNNNVVYPFGYGLSYTTFEQRITSAPTNMAFSDEYGNGTLTVRVSVKNTGSVAGRDTVEIYATAPYTTGKIEKAHVVLVGFAKTDVIRPNETKTVEVKIDLYDLASYDYNDKNNNNFKGYELERGNYVFRLMKNSHEEIENFTLNLANSFEYRRDPLTHTVVENLYDDASSELGSVLSRANWNATFPQSRTADEKRISAETNAAINSVEHNNPNSYSTRPSMGVTPEKDEEGNALYDFRSLVGLSYDDPLWDTVLDYLTYDEMVNLIYDGAFKTNELKSIGKAETIDADGPAGWADFMGGSNPQAPVYEVSHYCCEPLMAATWNIERLEDIGKAVGDEALIGDERNGVPYSGWYAPGMNIHRSPFGGRAGEYFSEDPLLSGLLGAYEIKGAMSKGVYTQVKHFAFNEQETSRGGVCTWLTEQSMREIYLKTFEKAVKIGGATGMMSSFNRVGAKWTGGDYRLLTTILRDEWGFRGMVISDYNTSSFMNTKQEAYAGGDLQLNAVTVTKWLPGKTSANDLTVLRNCAKNILYTTVNSNLTNVDIIGYRLPYWQIGMIVLDGVAVASFGIWGFFAIRKVLKGKK